ncbi:MULTISPECIES: replicative DNA helicase [unclassified Gilliamella]|uniref:replicative DNA helicase n=1 Tax=unclassified Gilliamella TaxID=2685620 RepID=UPI00080DEDBA|nr:DnaB-like helicase C-terminal domain-containing protein [Gilliamella apicola]OCG33670.1 helicase DnaB [Gilliamella apicola]OCG49055.1 helicase DnaB [Gilliamella apicola]OCG51803.1 helicase DnaB [Gilliamella apicola]
MNVIPHDLVAEQAVLGSMMLDFQSDRCQKAIYSLKPESFYSRHHQVIFAEMLELNRKNYPIDLITLSDSMEAKGTLKDCGGLAYLAELSKNTPSMINVTAYAGIVRDKAIERYTLQKLNDCSAMIFEKSNLSTSDKISAIHALFTQIDDYNKTGKTTGLKSLKTIADKWTETLGQRLENADSARGLSTGIKALDEKLAPKGLVRGSLFVVGARPKMGKTTFEINMARYCAMNEKLPVLMFSLEMQDEQMLENILAQESGVNSNIFYDGGLGSDSEFARVMHHLNELSNTDNIYIDDTPAITLSHIRSEARRMAREKGQIGMIMVDYLTLMEKEKTGDDTRNDLAYGAITKGLKALAKELNCVVVMLTQLNRNLESRADKRPIPSDSRDTGQIEQDCDYWVGIYRDAVYNDNADKNLMEINVALNRHGAGNFTVFAGISNGRIYEVDQLESQARANPEPVKKERKYARAG